MEVTRFPNSETTIPCIHERPVLEKTNLLALHDDHAIFTVRLAFASLLKKRGGFRETEE